ncbi:MAG: hypothetical protein AAGH65_05760 [Pseudomonadota bacterium]
MLLTAARGDIRRQELRELGAAVALALGVHLAALALLIVAGLDWEPPRPPPPQAFTLVDAAPFFTELEREQQAEAAERRIQEAQREQEQLRQEREAQQQVEQERQAAEQERQRRLEEQRRIQLEREQAQEAERAAQRELEREQQRLRDEEQSRLDELRRLREQRELAQREREQEEQRLEELAERRRQEQALIDAEQEAERIRLAQQQAAASEQVATLTQEYILTIAELVRRNWIRPPTTQPGVRCSIRVVQIPGGEIIDQAITNPCNADDATRRSILAAVQRTAQLPYRGYEDVFAREIEFIFRYDGEN